MDATRHEEVLRCLFRESNDAFFLFDPSDLRVVDLNPTALRMTGYDRKAALGLRVADLFGSDDPQGVDRLIEAYRKTGVFHSREEYSLRRAEGGEPIAVNLSASRIHTKPEPLGLVVVRDISERRKAQEVLERFFLLSPALFGILSPGGRLARTNRAWGHVLGYSAEDLRSIELLDLVHPDDRDSAALALALALEGGRGEAAGPDVRCLHKGGGDRWLSWSSARVGGDRYVVALDVTAAKEAADLRLAKEAAELANRAKGQFLSSMSHELRTPLTAILALTDVVLADPAALALGPDRVADLRTIQRNGDYLHRLINSVLDLAKIDAGKFSVDPVPCDPERMVAEVADLIKARARAKGLALVVERPGAIPATVRTDPVRLRQILINLVGNAVKFTEEGGVTVRLGVPPGASSPPMIRFEVADTGPGIGPEEAASLFQPFRQGGGARRRSPGGSGLGLAISRGLAEAMGGTLTVASEPGVGSTFALTLPTGEPEGRDPQPVPGFEVHLPKREPRTPRPHHVLLAEDNADNRRAIALRLEQAGLRVTPARNGQEALDLALDSARGGRAFDVILMDMQMPVLDGYEATRLLRASDYRGPIIALTAFALDEDRDECLRFGCTAHVSKPIDWEPLLDMIDGLAAGAG